MSINRRFTVVVAVALALSAAPTAMAFAQGGGSGEGRIRIEYVPPKNPEHQALYERLQARHVLENVQTIFSPLRFPVDMKVLTVGCNGESNALYERFQREDKKPTVTICYEYLHEILQAMPKTTTPAGVSPMDAVIGQFMFAVAHEMGHGSFDMFDVPIFGREEDAADGFATFVLLQFRNDEALRLVAGAAYGYHEFIKDYKQKPNVTWPLAAFSSDHGLPEQRFANLICLAYGYDAQLFADVVDKEYLPASRAKRCRYEYLILRDAMRNLIRPHVDMEAARKVFNMQWLAARTPVGN